MTQEAYFTRHGISVGSLRRWRRILSEGDAPRPEVTAAATQFVPVRLVGDASATPSAELTLVLTDVLRLEIGPECRAETLRRVLGVLQERA